MSSIQSKITAPKQKFIANDLNFMNDVNHSKTAPEQNQCSEVKPMNDVPGFGIAVGFAVGVAVCVELTLTHCNCY